MATNLASASPEPMRLGDTYRPLVGQFDEMRTSDGGLRPHWQYLIDALREIGPEGIDSRWQEARRLVRDNGVTYNVYGDPQGMSRPWELDPLPLLIRGEEWAGLERGLIQRAELLNALLLDLYGLRSVIDKGLLPPELIDGFPGYLLPCHGAPVAGDRPLVLYAVDLTRDASGAWRVIGDRTQIPSGSGYALENRVVLSRVMPSLFRDSHVHRLAGFYRSVRRAMTRIAPRHTDHARVAVLTPGPRNEAYFEHAYLANYLGFNLVQGSDLSVRDGALWLRTLGRLERIDALMRRVDDLNCDPLELKESSLLGVPGMLQAVRAGNLGIANALGSGVLEHPGLMAFLPALCEHLLGEALLLPHLQTWWCGQREARDFVVANLENLVIKPAGSPAGQRCLFGAKLEAEQRDELIAAIRREPHRYVAQEAVQPSTAPAYINGLLEPRPFVLRSFLVSEQEGYAVMPGGLSRIALDTDTPMISNQLGGLGKDTWVLASEPERQETLIVTADANAPAVVPAVVQESEVSSRVADNLFWIGRYAERAEGLVRLLRIVIIQITERSSLAAEADADCCLHLLLAALTNQSQTFPGFIGEGAPELLAQPVPEVLSLISDQKRAGALPQTLQALGQAAWSVRERLSNDTWRVTNDIERRQRLLTQAPPRGLGRALDLLDPLITSLVAFSALTHENMTHNEGWHFLEAGRRLERGLHTASLLRSTLVSLSPDAGESILVEAVLGVTDSLITYRRRYQAGTRVGAMLDLVLRDEANPRSLAYQIARLSTLVDEMPGNSLSTRRTPAQRILMRLLTELRLAELDLLAQPSDGSPRRGALDGLLASVETSISALSDAITAQYFRHEEQPHHLIGQRSEAEAAGQDALGLRATKFDASECLQGDRR
ncbi:MAG: circularly permuted type 2 ATP-grasp protein [Lamprobacter sp.]|uniref:circularly permuted type 2 ATP-grasp protein n=1 Tax=Lamprobacter sp. TaxID=3100796 RepID=UPI002B25C49A|nr:circularly permuted type 2 ATP-grasp protein [Lamprobacter sp.]MEA3640212.1 circularly permuted type 2 ATP-grasp protein [Lamprobacter sp.]